MQQLESTAAQLLLAVWRPPYTGLIARRHLQVNLRDVYRNFYRIVFPGRSSAMRQLESALTGILSLYGVRHIAELPLAITCKRACVTSVAIFTALVFLAVRLPCSSSSSP